jgi:hypothetical protein
MKHYTVFAEKGRFGGWPANYGIWNWGSTISVGFQDCAFRLVGEGNHAIDKDKPRILKQARFIPSEERWTIEEPQTFQQTNMRVLQSDQWSESLDFTAQETGLFFLRHLESDGAMYSYYTIDAGHSWIGPFEVRIFDGRKIDPRIDYVIEGPQQATVFLTAYKDDGQEGRVFCIRTVDGGKSWVFCSWIGKEEAGFTIMPSTVKLNDGTFLVAVRWQREGRWGIDLYSSTDDCKSWTVLSQVVEGEGLSNPPSMLQLADGRLCLCYGYRSSPYGIRYKLSNDNGVSWQDEKILREDGGNWDLGYVRSTQLPSGDVLAAYYFCADKSKERTIEATVFTP